MNTPFDEAKPAGPKRSALAGLRANFLTGLVVIAPISLTGWLIWTFVGWVDGFVLPLVPNRLQPEQYIGINLRGVGVIFFLIFTVIIGYLAKGLIGRSLIRWAEGLVARTPIVRSVYGGLKQIAETVFAQTETSFDRACLIEYPRRGMWAVAFISTTAKGEIDERIPDPNEYLLVMPGERVQIGERIGTVLRTRTNVKPVYVSIGHRLTLEEAETLTLRCCPRYKIPEPTRRAHHLSRRE